MWQSLEILDVFNNSKQICWKKNIFFKKLEYRFLVESNEISQHLHSKLPCQKPMFPLDTRRRFNVGTSSYDIAGQRIEVETTPCV